MSRFVRFSSTLWTVVHSAGAGDKDALEAFARQYREPVVRYLRARGLAREVADDLAQEVFLRLFQKDLLAKVDRSRGKFRSFLLGVTNNVLREHRAADRRRMALPREVPAQDEEDFAREWMLHLVDIAVRTLAQSERDNVRRDLAIFRACLWDRLSYAQLAAAFDVNLDAVKNALYETRRRIREEVGTLVNAYACSRADFADEMAAYDTTAARLARGR
ncbi:MAG: sigma-70 family RNA polymerase sigma factor [Planctomycetes bacterium]|nr:sigma-70 family RNA polymerase sigma factor [Planctomycetota bacterium]